MAIELTQVINNQIANRNIKAEYSFYINSDNFSAQLVGWSTSDDKTFGASTATFVVANPTGSLSPNGSTPINVGDIVEFYERYIGDTIWFKRFYGKVDSRNFTSSAQEASITLVCYDYIVSLKETDINFSIEGERVRVSGEKLSPQFLPAPNGTLAQVFNFANSSVADNPLPYILIRDRLHEQEDPQTNGFSILYEQGQLRLGSPINASLNYDIYADYSYYVSGVYAEDILQIILTEPDGYGVYLFGESSRESLVENHLIETFSNVELRASDTLVPNLTPTNITIRHFLATDILEGTTSLVLDSVEGLPESGTGSINGDLFTWSSISSGNTLEGIPATGEYSLKVHRGNDILKYTNTYDAGQVWYLSYNNIVTVLSGSDFTIPSGNAISYFDSRYGRIILETPITESSIVTCNIDYNFNTLQATGIELSSFSINPRETPNRYEAINKLRGYLAPNYIIRTRGTDKIWAMYLGQKTIPDYTLNLVNKLEYIEDSDLYTRVKFFGKNKNPTNLMFNEGIDFFSAGADYHGHASNVALEFHGKEDNYFIYRTEINNRGYINTNSFIPVVYINGVAIDGNVHFKTNQQVRIAVEVKTITKAGCHGISSDSYIKSHSYYKYTGVLPFNNIEPSKPVELYLAGGAIFRIIPPFDPLMDYANGMYAFSIEDYSAEVETVSSASFYIKYSTGDVVIDYENALFKLKKSLFNDYSSDVVTADYDYWTVIVPVQDVAAVIDGRPDTQVQVEFFAEPPANFPLTVMDLGRVYTIQAMDILAGFYKPSTASITTVEGKYDIEFTMSLKYSLDGIDYFDISSATSAMTFSGGKLKSLEESDLGAGFQARYLFFSLDNVKPIPLSDPQVLYRYGNDPDVDRYNKASESSNSTFFYRNYLYPVSLVEISAYEDIILESEAKLIPTTRISQQFAYPDNTILNVVNTYGFDEPESGESVSALIGTTEFTYTGITDTSFTGVTIDIPSGTVEIVYPVGTGIFKNAETDTSIFDYDALLPKLGDRLYQDNRIENGILYDITRLNAMSTAFLREFVKNHTRVSVDVVYSPYLEVGHTILVIDSFNNIDRNYFIESIVDNKGYYTLSLAYYPSN